MQQRTVLVPPSSLGALDALRMVFSDIADISGQTPLNIDALFASTIFQAGIDRFLTFGDTPSDYTPARFISDRTSTIEPPDLNDFYRRIHAVFESQFVRPPNRDSRIFTLPSLIVDLVIAARYRTSLVTTLPLEDISNFRDVLRPEFFASLERFFASLEHDAAGVPLPRSTVRTADIDRIRTVLDSDLFTDYSRAHHALESPVTEMRIQIRRVEDAARNLTRGFSDYLSIRNLVLSGLSITGKTIELFLGSLSASVLAPFKNFFESYFSADHRVVIYNFYDVWHAQFEKQIQRLLELERQSKKAQLPASQSNANQA